MEAKLEVNQLIETVRKKQLPAGLVAVGQFAFGYDCTIVTNGFGFCAIDAKTGFVLGAGTPLASPYRVCREHSLESFDLAMVLTEHVSQDLQPRARMGLLLFRVGLLLRILDLSFAHLADRVSGGQKTLRHQLVKSTFSECFSLAETIRCEAPYLLQSSFNIDLCEQHRAITSATTKAAKLMGGHGFLASQANALEFLSLGSLNQAAQEKSVLFKEAAA